MTKRLQTIPAWAIAVLFLALASLVRFGFAIYVSEHGSLTISGIRAVEWLGFALALGALIPVVLRRLGVLAAIATGIAVVLIGGPFALGAITKPTVKVTLDESTSGSISALPGPSASRIELPHLPPTPLLGGSASVRVLNVATVQGPLNARWRFAVVFELRNIARSRIRLPARATGAGARAAIELNCRDFPVSDVVAMRRSDRRVTSLLNPKISTAAIDQVFRLGPAIDIPRGSTGIVVALLDPGVRLSAIRPEDVQQLATISDSLALSLPLGASKATCR